jgi:hypothetical protein
MAKGRTPDNFFEVFNLCGFMPGFLTLFPLLSVAMITSSVAEKSGILTAIMLSTSNLKGP